MPSDLNSGGAPAYRRAAVTLAAATFVWCVALVVLQWLRLRAFVHLEYEDDALYIQLLDSISRGAMDNTIHPGHRPSHFIPILYVLWPAYIALGGGWPAVWIIKVAAVASGAGALFALAARRGASARVALAFGLVWLALPGVISLTLSTFRPLTLSAGALLWLIEAFVARRFNRMLGLMGLVLLCREDLGLTVGLLGGVALVTRAPARYVITPPLVAGLWFVLASSLLPDYTDVIVGTNLAEGGLMGKVRAVFEPTHLRYYAALVVPLALLPLGSPVTLVGLVGVAAVALNQRPFAGHLVHLATPAVAAAAAGAVLTWTRLSPQWRRRGGWALGACLLLAHVQPWIPPTLALPSRPDVEVAGEGDLSDAWSPFSPRYYRTSRRDALRWQAVARVPPGASVAASGHLLPALSPRPVLYELGHWSAPFGRADWLVVESRNLYGGAGAYVHLSEEQIAAAMPVITRWFEREWEQDGIVVFRRLRPGDATEALRATLHPGGYYRERRRSAPGGGPPVRSSDLR